jgi:hypothetical protein
MAEGFSKDEILVFHRAGFSTNVARQWKGMGLSLPEIQHFSILETVPLLA